MTDKLGIFLCGCGPNLGGKISLADLAAYARTLPGVRGVWVHDLLCSAAGQSLLVRDIRESAVEKVVVAGCSPREHEQTFRKVLEKAGLNPYLLQMVNLREQCAWVTPDPEQAAHKARALLLAAVGRVREQRPIFIKEKEVNPDVLVVGAGVAGLTVSLSLTGPGRRIHLVDRAPFIGGKTVLYEKVFPALECGACLLSPWIDRLLHEEAIRVHLPGEIRQIKGSFGNFQVSLLRRARGVDPEKCLGCGACQEVCPVRAPNEHLLGLTDRPAIYLPFPGALPAVALLDRDRCLYHQGEECRACREVCPTGAVALDQEDQTLAIEVGAIVLATGFEAEPGETVGAGDPASRPGFLSGLETEILLNSSGPTGGRLPWPKGLEKGKVGIIACRGGEADPAASSAPHPLLGPYLKLARQIREQRPEAAITIFYRELNLPGPEGVRFFRELQGEAGIIYKRLDPGETWRARCSAGGQWLEYGDGSGNRAGEAFDLLIAAGEFTGSAGAPELAKKLHLPLDEAGFWKTLADQLAPVNTPIEGIYAIGCARGPRDISGAVLDGQAAAGQIRSRLVPGQKIVLEPLTVEVLEEYCSGCGICLATCPFLALEQGPDPGPLRVNEVLCRGCGLCAAACPSGAIRARHYGNLELTAEIKGLLHAENG